MIHDVESRRAAAEPEFRTPEQLIYCIAQGDPLALIRLKATVRAFLLSIAFRYLRNRADVDEVVADVYARVWFHAHRFDPSRGTALTWLAALCRNAAIDCIRRLRADNAASTWEIEGPIAAEGCLESIVENAQAHELMLAAVSQLPTAQRHILLLAFRDGLSHREISRAHNVPLGTVKSHISRSLARLRKNVNLC